MNNDSLKLSLVDKLNKVQIYPKFNEFKEETNPELMEKLENVIAKGNFTLYKLKDSDNEEIMAEELV